MHTQEADEIVNTLGTLFMELVKCNTVNVSLELSMCIPEMLKVKNDKTRPIFSKLLTTAPSYFVNYHSLLMNLHIDNAALHYYATLELVAVANHAVAFDMFKTTLLEHINMRMFNTQTLCMTLCACIAKCCEHVYQSKQALQGRVLHMFIDMFLARKLLASVECQDILGALIHDMVHMRAPCISSQVLHQVAKKQLEWNKLVVQHVSWSSQESMLEVLRAK